MLVDAHCHLDFPQFDSDRDEVVKRAAGIAIVNSTVNPELVGKALAMPSRYPNVWCTLGFSASDLDEARCSAMMSHIREYRDRIVGLGEVGLDYYWVKDEAGRAKEKGHFRALLGLAAELSLPVVVHSRDAEGDCINILGDFKVRAMMHCFSGSVEEAMRAQDMGFLISVPANVGVSKARQKTVAALPLQSLVLETDAPYLSPLRGERNEPANVREAAKAVARIKGVSVQAVEEATSANAANFFGIRW
jgi:TatD DNase family protein